MREKSFGIIPVYQEHEDSEPLFLLIQHQKGHWAFPKGGPEEGESAIMSARREFEEETGITDYSVREDVSFIDHYFFKRDNKLVDKTVTYFLGVVRDQRVRVQEEEVFGARWVNYKDALQIATFDGTKQLLRKTRRIILKNNTF